jgi:peptide/nickel transport system permease protein
MKVVRVMAACILAAAVLVSLGAGVLAPYDYAAQFRDHANEPPSRSFPLGTDELGRDRLSRLLEGTRVSVVGSMITASLATAISAGMGLAAGYYGGWVDEASSGVTDLFLSLPWLFVLLTLRALLPLDLSPRVSLAATFLVVAAVGWAAGSRVVRAGTAKVRNAGCIVQARACGCGGARLLWVHVLPNLRPVISAQFWIMVPVFLLTEANLGVLGLGAAEPIPSWGGMMAELQNYSRIPEAPWILAPAVVLVLVVASLHFVVSGRQTWE